MGLLINRPNQRRPKAINWGSCHVTPTACFGQKFKNKIRSKRAQVQALPGRIFMKVLILNGFLMPFAVPTGSDRDRHKRGESKGWQSMAEMQFPAQDMQSLKALDYPQAALSSSSTIMMPQLWQRGFSVCGDSLWRPNWIACHAFV